MEARYQKKVVGKSSQKLEIKNLTLSAELYLKNLEIALEYVGIPRVYYSLNAYSEDAVCIEQGGNDWIVYNGEKGNKYNIKKYNDIISACHNLISRVSESEEEKRHVMTIFKRNLILDKHKMLIKKSNTFTGSKDEDTTLNDLLF